MPKGIQCPGFTKPSVEKTYEAHKAGISICSDRRMDESSQKDSSQKPHGCDGGLGVSTGCGEEKELQFPWTSIRILQKKPRSARSSGSARVFLRPGKSPDSMRRKAC